MKYKLSNLLVVVALTFATGIAMANVPHCIGVNNQSNYEVIYLQLPNDIGDVSVDAHSKKIICEAAPSEIVTLEDPQTYRILVQTKMKRCTTINYYGLEHHPAWTVTPGCA